MKKKFGRASSVGVIGGATAVFVVSKKKIEKRAFERAVAERESQYHFKPAPGTGGQAAVS